MDEKEIDEHTELFVDLSLRFNVNNPPFYITRTSYKGRLGNQIIRNLATSLLVEKHNIVCFYSSSDRMKQLGLPLYSGKNIYLGSIIPVENENYLEILNSPILQCAFQPNDFFQTKEITNLIYRYLHKESSKNCIINFNPFKERYNNNDDVFIHVRLDDLANYNPGINYYLKALSNISFLNVFISTDEKDHLIIKQIMEAYPNSVLFLDKEIRTIQFGSTCKHVILTQGSFSAVIGYLSFFSNVYYPSMKKLWGGDVLSIEGWNKIDNYDSNDVTPNSSTNESSSLQGIPT